MLHFLNSKFHDIFQYLFVNVYNGDKVAKQKFFSRVVFTLSVLFFGIGNFSLYYTKKIIKQHKRKLIKNSSINIGAIFGMDVGGTLAKLVYFEKNGNIRNENYGNHKQVEHGQKTLKKCDSFARLDSPDHQAALEKMYTFIEQGSVMARDDALSFYSPLLGGNFHFLHFESKLMQKSISLLSETSLIENIHTMGCTGGGAYKYKKEFSEQLGIHVELHDELGSLIKGMCFAMATVPGECYAYRNVPSETSATTIREKSTSEKRTKTWDDHSPVPVTRGRSCSSDSGQLYMKLYQNQDNTRAPSSMENLKSNQSHSNPNSTSKASSRGRNRTCSFNATPTPSFISAKSIYQDNSAKTAQNNSCDMNDGNSKTITETNQTEDSQNVQPTANDYIYRVDLPSDITTSQFPYLVVNIGSGVSILKVNSTTHFERVSGSSIGGGTFWGLCKLFTNANTYEEALNMSEDGDSTQLDMLVRDIYGGGYDAMKLSGTMVASSFGKLSSRKQRTIYSHLHDASLNSSAEDTRPISMDDEMHGEFGPEITDEDISQALLLMITNNIGQVAYLNAKLHNCNKICFMGNFLRKNQISCRRLAFAIDFWSKKQMEATFFKHEGYFGALGTFLGSAFGSHLDDILQFLNKNPVV